MSQFQNPPPRSMRISDMYFPDPMFYPGFYPSGMNNQYDPYSRYPDQRMDMSQMFDKMARVDNSRKYMHNDFDKYERNRVNQIPRDKPRYNALSDFVNTVHGIHSKGRGSYNSTKGGSNMSNYGSYGMGNSRMPSYSSGGVKSQFYS